MIIYRARAFDTPVDPFTGGALRADSDVAFVIDDGLIVARTDFDSARSDHPGTEVIDLRSGILIPGMIDTHVHYPQVRSIGHLGLPLLDWLDRHILPAESELADEAHARDLATDFVTGLTSAGTTSALVFGSHFASAVDSLFARAAEVGLRITSGLVTSDRNLPEALLTTPERSNREGQELIDRWHGKGRARYAVTPRFSFSASEELLAAGAELMAANPGVWFTSHVNENLAEVDGVAELFPEALDYVDTYDRAGLLGPRSVLAHNVHPRDRELERMAATGTIASHCPTSNSNLASGFFPLQRHLEHGVRVALGSDVGGGTGFSLLKEGLQAYFMQQLNPGGGFPLTSTHLLHLATAAGAEALELGDDVGDLSVGKRFDAVLIEPTAGEPLDVGITHADSDEDALAKIFAMGTSGDISRVWIDGELVKG